MSINPEKIVHLGYFEGYALVNENAYDRKKFHNDHCSFVIAKTVEELFSSAVIHHAVWDTEKVADNIKTQLSEHCNFSDYNLLLVNAYTHGNTFCGIKKINQVGLKVFLDLSVIQYLCDISFCDTHSVCNVVLLPKNITDVEVNFSEREKFETHNDITKAAGSLAWKIFSGLREFYSYEDALRHPEQIKDQEKVANAQAWYSLLNVEHKKLVDEYITAEALSTKHKLQKMREFKGMCLQYLGKGMDFNPKSKYLGRLERL